MPTTMNEADVDRAVLSKADQKRLERLARRAGRTPQAMLRFVLRDGFAACEEAVTENQAADLEFERGEGIDHVDVMHSARRA